MFIRLVRQFRKVRSLHNINEVEVEVVAEAALKLQFLLPTDSSPITETRTLPIRRMDRQQM